MTNNNTKNQVLTLKKQIEICNAVNTAIANGLTVFCGEMQIIHGMTVLHGQLAYFAELINEPNKYFRACHADYPRIIAVNLKDLEIDVIYDPLNSSGNCDLSRASPVSVPKRVKAVRKTSKVK